MSTIDNCSGGNTLSDIYRKISSDSMTSSERSSALSMISQEELQRLINEANQCTDEFCPKSEEIRVISLHREFKECTIGVALERGSDYEDVTVHEIISESLADRDGRIRVGDKILSINGRLTKNLTHKKAVSMLKSPRKWIILVVSRSPPPQILQSPTSSTNIPWPQLKRIVEFFELGTQNAFVFQGGRKDTPSPLKASQSTPQQTIKGKESEVLDSNFTPIMDSQCPLITVVLTKEGAGLGFSLEGGKDSPLGDMPLTIKKIFTGGTAHKDGKLIVGDEVISVNGVDFTLMSRFRAWNFLKNVETGPTKIVIKRK